MKLNGIIISICCFFMTLPVAADSGNSSIPEDCVPVYVLNYADGSISVIDGNKEYLVRTIKLPDRASTFSILPDGNLAVAITGVGDLLAPSKAEIHIITPKGRRLKKMKIWYIPDNMYVDDEGRLALIFHSTEKPLGRVPFTLIDLEKQEEVGRFSLDGFITAVQFLETGLILYACGSSRTGLSTGIYRLAFPDLTINRIMPLGGDQVFGKRALLHDGKLYGIRGSKKTHYLKHNQTLQVIDIQAKEIEKILPLSDNPNSIVIVEDKIYVTHYDISTPSGRSDNRVSVIDRKSYDIEDTIIVGQGSRDICYSKRLGKVFTANAWDQSVSVIDAKTQKVLKTISTNQRFPFVIRCPE